VLVSSDKAVEPANVLGATKQLAERLVLALGKSSKTAFFVVRFGNVLGSSGSVVPLFQEQINAGGPVTITHPEAKRFFMTIEEACLLILQAALLGQQGDILVLDMGHPMRIIDLANRLIMLSGRRPGLDIPITVTGLRPGEKLEENLFAPTEQVLATAHPKIRAARPTSMDDLAALLAALDELAAACGQGDVERADALLWKLVQEPLSPLTLMHHAPPISQHASMAAVQEN
jgi:FlaA1/EpsC-like NDP-sugar epimerase